MASGPRKFLRPVESSFNFLPFPYLHLIFADIFPVQFLPSPDNAVNVGKLQKGKRLRRRRLLDLDVLSNWEEEKERETGV